MSVPRKKNVIGYGLPLVAFLLVTGCSSGSGGGGAISMPGTGGAGTGVVVGPRTVGSVSVPSGAQLVPVPGQPLPNIVTKFRGVGN